MTWESSGQTTPTDSCSQHIRARSQGRPRKSTGSQPIAQTAYPSCVLPKSPSSRSARSYGWVRRPRSAALRVQFHGRRSERHLSVLQTLAADDLRACRRLSCSRSLRLGEAKARAAANEMPRLVRCERVDSPRRHVRSTTKAKADAPEVSAYLSGPPSRQAPGEREHHPPSVCVTDGTRSGLTSDALV